MRVYKPHFQTKNYKTVDTGAGFNMDNMSSNNRIAAWRVTSLLLNDVTLLLNSEIFGCHLGLQPSEQIQDRQGFVSGALSPFALLYGIILKWVAGNGQGATIRVLGQVLKNTRHVACHDQLLQTFPNHDAVITTGEGRNAYYNNQHASQWSAPQPSQDEIREYEKPELKTKTAPSGVSILELMPHRQAGHGRLVIVISYLLQMLSKIGANPVAIVSINGRQRSGKSFLATQMVKYLKGRGGNGSWLDSEMSSSFTFSDSQNRVTSGIQVWHEPLQVQHEGKTINVIVLDTQGLHDENTGAQENAVIFGLSVLLSSVFIYNERNIADDSLQYLRSFLEFARFAAAGERRNEAENSANGNSAGRQQLKFQKLILLLRDFRASREYKCGYYDDNHCPPGQTANLKTAQFDITPAMHDNAVETRDGIRQSFENISVYALSGPGNRYPDMPEYLHSSSWDPDFRNGVLDFAEKVLSPRCIANSTKKVFDEEVTGEELIPYVSKWAELIQGTDGVIQSQTIFETTVELFFNKKIAALQNEYETIMNEYISEHDTGIAEQVFQEFHSQTMGQLDSRFSSGGAYGGNTILQKYRAKLHERINGVRDQFVKTNLANIKAASESQLREQAWNTTMRQAEARVNDARNDLALAQSRRQHVINNQSSYTKPVSTKHRTSFLGFNSTPYYTIDMVPDPAAYQAALNLAEEEVKLKELRVAETEENLQLLENTRPAPASLPANTS